MSMSLSLPRLLLALPFLAPTAVAQSSALSLFAADATLLRSADRDGDGDVTADEWRALVDEFARDGTFDRTAIAAHAVRPMLDTDRDGRFTGADVQATLSAIDADSSGSLERGELGTTLMSFGSGGRPAQGDRNGSGWNPLAGVVAFGADSDGDDRVSADEWRAAVEGAGAGKDVPTDTLMGWITRAEMPASDDPSAIGASTLLVTFSARLDANHDTRLDRDDFDAMFASLDGDGDGRISSAELNAPTALAAGRSSARGTQTRGNATETDAAADRPAASEPTAGGDGDDGANAAARRRRDAELARVQAANAVDGPLMPWQRSLDDALELVRRTGKPLLICVNTAGEMASEALATRRYRDPQFVELVRGFIPVLASPDQRTPRDHDGRGWRIEDDKFGRLLNAEHIGIEPTLFERYFRGTRVAPRHIGVSPAGEILFDLYLLNNLGAIDDALRRHGKFDTGLPDVDVLDVEGLLASPDAAARERLETYFQRTVEETRTYIARRALDADRVVQHPEIVRMALRDADDSVRNAALTALAEHPERVPVELFTDAARAAAGDPATCHALSAGLARVASAAEGADRTRAQRLSLVLAGTGGASSAVDPTLWSLALASAEGAADDGGATFEGNPYEVMGLLSERLAARPDDGVQLRTLLAQTALRAAETMIVSGEREAGTLLADSQDAAERALRADPGATAAWAVLARAAHLQGDVDAAIRAGEHGLPRLVLQAGSRAAAETLEAFAQGRHRALNEASSAESAWPSTWIADIEACYAVLADHPRTTEEQLLTGLDTLARLELHAAFDQLLAGALRRHPTSTACHEYLRWSVLEFAPPEALGPAYEQLAYDDADAPTVLWFDGYAQVVAAERLRENGRPDAALAAYERAIDRFDRSFELEPSFENALWFAAQSWAGMAQVHLEQGSLGPAAHALRQAARTDPKAFGAEDGLGRTPAATMRMLFAALRRADWGWLADELDLELNEAGVQ